MRLSSIFVTGITIVALCLGAPGQGTPGKETPASEAKGIPPRETPNDYQAHGAAGTVTVAAEFMGHSILTPDGTTYTTEDYVAVETGLYGPAGAGLKISASDFTLRVYAKKMTSLPSQPFGVVFRSLKDPVWEDQVSVEQKEKKSSTGISTGGQNKDNSPPAPVHMPLEMLRAMQQRVQKSALPEGDRTLPQAGLLFFPFRGKTQGIRAMELVYAGPAGTATLALQP
jgi:hypothetical protein